MAYLVEILPSDGCVLMVLNGDYCEDRHLLNQTKLIICVLEIQTLFLKMSVVCCLKNGQWEKIKKSRDGPKRQNEIGQTFSMEKQVSKCSNKTKYSHRSFKLLR